MAWILEKKLLEYILYFEYLPLLRVHVFREYINLLIYFHTNTYEKYLFIQIPSRHISWDAMSKEMQREKQSFRILEKMHPNIKHIKHSSSDIYLTSSTSKMFKA